MTDMVERVALAMVGEMFAAEELPLDDKLMALYHGVARAAIAAMREPTEAMQMASGTNTLLGSIIYRDMISAALK